MRSAHSLSCDSQGLCKIGRCNDRKVPRDQQGHEMRHGSAGVYMTSLLKAGVSWPRSPVKIASTHPQNRALWKVGLKGEGL